MPIAKPATTASGSPPIRMEWKGRAHQSGLRRARTAAPTARKANAVHSPTATNGSATREEGATIGNGKRGLTGAGRALRLRCRDGVFRAAVRLVPTQTQEFGPKQPIMHAGPIPLSDYVGSRRVQTGHPREPGQAGVLGKLSRLRVMPGEVSGQDTGRGARFVRGGERKAA